MFCRLIRLRSTPMCHRRLWITKVSRRLWSSCPHGFRWVWMYFQTVALNGPDSYSHKRRMQFESGTSRFPMKHLQKPSWWHPQAGVFLPIQDRTCSSQIIDEGGPARSQLEAVGWLQMVNGFIGLSQSFWQEEAGIEPATFRLWGNCFTHQCFTGLYLEVLE